ncbi:diheme cytochrome c [Rubrivivax sp. RP6-9]|uniref:diheme cytochrome c n=1 Tax=Rubrivivax sp. RP6-9 TaxID=3415750 RepID=UPI003CC5AD56
MSTPRNPRLAARNVLPTLLSIAFLAALPAATLADSGRAMPQPVPAAYTQECASCHMAYPPGLLPARSWQRLMGGLERHYGSDASLDAATRQPIDAWLQANAGTYKRVAEEPPQDRITRSAWFARKHRQIDPAVWQLASVRSAAQCAACHTDAERGRFDDDALRVPAGLPASQRRAWLD